MRSITLFIVGIIFCIGSLLLIGNGFREYNLSYSFIKDGIKTSAQVDYLYQLPHRHTPDYMVIYHFGIQSPDAPTSTVKESIAEKAWSRLHVGELIPIVYLKQDPKISRIAIEG